MPYTCFYVLTSNPSFSTFLFPVAVQCSYRCRRARTALKVLKIAAKDVGKLQLNNEALKLEIEQLRARAKDETRRMIAETEER